MPGARVALIGAPTDVGAGLRGACMGPQALRVAGLVQSLQSLGVPVIDTGDLVGPPRPTSPQDARGPHHLDEVIAWNRTVFDAVDRCLSGGDLPVLLGGDHSLAVGSISAIARHCDRQGRRLRVLWLDAHADVNDAITSPSGNLHGMPVACLLGRGPASLVGWSDQPQALHAADIAFIGIRSVDAEERSAIARLGLRVWDMRAIDEHGMRHALNEALQGIDADTHLHVSFDLDALDPVHAPGVSTGVPGGLTYREIQLCMEMIADTGCLRSLDVMEINPAQDVRNRTAELAVQAICSLLGAATLAR
jgi:arginase